MTIRFWVGGVCAVLAFNSGCGSSLSDEASADEAAPDRGATSLALTVDPFEPTSCPDTGIDAATARAQWGISDRAHVLGPYQVTMRERRRSASEPSGWGPWTVSSGLVSQKFEVDRWIHEQPLQGTVTLAISKKGTFYLSLIDEDDDGSGVAGGIAYGERGIFDGVAYNYLQQQHRLTGYKPWVSSSGLVYKGALGPDCLRLIRRSATDLLEVETVIFAQLTTANAPLFTPSRGCYAAGTSVSLGGCGGLPVGWAGTACCAYGTETTSHSGCTCVSVED